MSFVNHTCKMTQIFEQCTDPRKCRIKHKLTDIIGIVILGTICGERVRRHWSIENEYHWHLDITFGEDASLISGKANRNLRIAREIALQLLRKDKSKQMGIKRKMRRCARSDTYFQNILSGSF